MAIKLCLVATDQPHGLPKLSDDFCCTSPHNTTGSIPAGLGTLAELTSINLACNRLTGKQSRGGTVLVHTVEGVLLDAEFSERYGSSTDELPIASANPICISSIFVSFCDVRSHWGIVWDGASIQLSIGFGGHGGTQPAGQESGTHGAPPLPHDGSALSIKFSHIRS